MPGNVLDGYAWSVFDVRAVTIFAVVFLMETHAAERCQMAKRGKNSSTKKMLVYPTGIWQGNRLASK